MIKHQGQGRLAACVALAVLSVTGLTAQAAQRSPPASNADTELSGVNVTPAKPDTPLSALAVPAMIQPADWIYKPRSFALFNFLPPKIVRTGIKGDVVLKCRVLPTSSVSDCSVLSDTSPTGVLGKAAMDASGLFKIKPRTVNGSLSDTVWVRIPISYNLGRMRQVGEPADEP